jgi:hypothetical protein
LAPQKNLLEQQLPHRELRQVTSESQEPVAETVRLVARLVAVRRRRMWKRVRQDMVHIELSPRRMVPRMDKDINECKTGYHVINRATCVTHNRGLDVFGNHGRCSDAESPHNEILLVDDERLFKGKRH